MNILAIGSHPDDIELGCAGLFLSALHTTSKPKISFLVLTAGDLHPELHDVRIAEQEAAIKMLSSEISLYQGTMTDAKLDQDYKGLVNVIENAIKETEADAIFTHSRNDTHHDHRAVYEASVEAGRLVKSIFSYEESISMNFNPQWYHDISKYVEKKIEVLSKHESQKEKISLRPIAIRALAKYRANQYQLLSRFNEFEIVYAEAFEVIKLGSNFTFLKR